MHKYGGRDECETAALFARFKDWVRRRFACHIATLIWLDIMRFYHIWNESDIWMDRALR